MTSDAVWNDAFSRATAVCQANGLQLIDPLVAKVDGRPDCYWVLDIASSVSDRLGMGEAADEETGQIMLHLMVRKASGINTPTALSHVKAMSTAFRASRITTQPQSWPEGLFYRGQSNAPPNLDDTGNWYVLTLMVDYTYQDALEQQP
ncbi:hypothetical protein [Acetobacter senegalensis]|uniref:hypothetical protein n=1 Tax=Acetobacter senegalensis TaxID=446692 RepID=UPI001EDA6B15|nr:hypothetical protein [Acetobacter senegalensis]MCG4258009.1 hypothetical protein [Acetobacter senegalensis]MCG4267936.1 hypothetical protein [Acetobacter senegalensis]